MANTIAKAKAYLPILDEVYGKAVLTSVLDAPADFVRAGLNANEILIPKMALQGLGDYSRSSGYVAGDVTLAWETHAFSQDRGRSFQVDSQDNLETIDTAFLPLASQFIRTKVAPEIDAYRFATLAGKANQNIAATLADSTAIQAIDTAIAFMKDAEVNMERCVLFISPTMERLIKQSTLLSRQFVVNVGNSVVNREVMSFDGLPVVVVPQTRFYSVVDLLDGSTSGEEAGGYAKASTGKNINFMIVDSGAVLGVQKTALPRIFTPEENQDANAWKFDYRLYHDIFVPDNKVKGVYVHTVA